LPERRPSSADRPVHGRKCGTLEGIKKPLPGARELRDGAFVCWWTELSLVVAIVLVVVIVAPEFLPQGAPPGASDHAIAAG
jgi:hypothetical protein